MCDNRGNIVSPFVTSSVNVHDSKLFPISLFDFLEFAHYLELDIRDSFLTLDSGFDSCFNRNLILDFNMTPIIKPNLRGLKNQTKRYERLDEFEKYSDVYDQRYIIERCFAWEDTYRRLATRYDRLETTFNGFRNLAYSLINFRNIFR